MTRLHSCLAVLLIASFAALANAQGRIDWLDKTYPTAGSTAGDIKVKGTVTIDAGWEYVAKQLTVRYWQSGKVLKEVPITPLQTDPKTFDWDVATAKSGTTFNVTVETTLQNKADTSQKVTICTEPRTAKAK